MVITVAAFTGARKGEICGFLGDYYDGYAMQVKQSVWRNHVGESKGEKSKGTIPVIAQLKLFPTGTEFVRAVHGRDIFFKAPAGSPRISMLSRVK
jgi:hypothetical protein